MRNCILLLLTIGLLGHYSAFSQANDGFDYGKVDGNIYVNSYFGFRLHIPEGWHVQSEEQVQQIMEAGRTLLAGDDQNMQALVKASQVQNATLLTVFQHEKGAPVDYNPGFTLVAENLSAFPGIKSGSDYLFHVRRFLEQSQIRHSFKEVYTTKVNGREFAAMEATIHFSGLAIKQTYYTTINNQFGISFITAYATDGQRKALNKILKTIKFDR
jgi:hypothetical protein